MNLLHPIHHTFAPHADWKYVLRSAGLMFVPWKWSKGGSVKILADELKKRFSADVFLFSSGRGAWCALLRSLKLKNGEEVIVQGYTCTVVPNAIHAAGGVPVYADIDRETLNLTAETVEPLVNGRTKAVICQHTFGIPAPAKELKELCEKHNLSLIEDCAHVMPDETGPKEICAHGDFIFFSFGRDKAISSVTGGAVLSRRNEISLRLHAERSRALYLSYWTILRLLTYPLIYFIARPLYAAFIGKAILYFLKKSIPAPNLIKKEPGSLTHRNNGETVEIIDKFVEINLFDILLKN